MPENVADALGITLSNFVSFDELVSTLTDPNCRPTRLKRFMPRKEAENAFAGALSKEFFKERSLFSYYFSEGWLEFVLWFDEKSRLRRLYIQHKCITQQEGIEIHLFTMDSTL